jgi:hypothetical protein
LKNRRSPAFLLGFFISKSKVQRAKSKEQSSKFKAKRSKIVSPVEPLAQSIEHKAKRIKLASPAANCNNLPLHALNPIRCEIKSKSINGISRY